MPVASYEDSQVSFSTPFIVLCMLSSLNINRPDEMKHATIFFVYTLDKKLFILIDILFLRF